jgi:hypothetical protein
LIRAKEGGVDVRVIADKAATCGRASGAELMVDPRSGARCAIRNTQAADDERY